MLVAADVVVDFKLLALTGTGTQLYGNYSVFASVAPPVDFDRARAPRLPLVAGSGGKRGGVGKPRGRLLEKSKESSAKVVAYQRWAV